MKDFILIISPLEITQQIRGQARRCRPGFGDRFSMVGMVGFEVLENSHPND